MYCKETIEPVLTRAKWICGVLRAAGYDAHIIGGALRVLAVGGTTSDVDIAVLGTQGESALLHEDLRILFKTEQFKLQHTQTYSSRCGFIADWRSGDINVICYDTDRYDTIDELVLGFDYNFNMWLLSDQGTLRNPFSMDNTVVTLNTNIATHHNLDKVKFERTPKFRAMLNHLDWSAVHDD